MYQVLATYRLIIGGQKFVQDFRYVAPFWDEGDFKLKAIEVENGGHKFRSFNPRKIRGGMDEMSGSIFVLDLGPDLWYTFDENRSAVWEIRGPVK